jgi:hypothetical protein
VLQLWESVALPALEKTYRGKGSPRVFDPCGSVQLISGTSSDSRLVALDLGGCILKQKRCFSWWNCVESSAPALLFKKRRKQRSSMPRRNDRSSSPDVSVPVEDRIFW